MHFEAILRGKKILIDVFESRHQWTVALQEEGKDKEVHKILKEHYRKMDDAISFLFQNSSYMVDVIGNGLDLTVYTRGSFRNIRLLNDEGILHESLKKGGSIGGSDQLTSGMPGKIVDVLVKVGDVVKPEQPLLIMEAMKMENEIRSSHEVRIKEIKVTKGQTVESGAVLMVFEQTKEQ